MGGADCVLAKSIEV